MPNKISPIIFFSISNHGNEMAKVIQNYSENINHPVRSRFIRFVSFNQNGTLTNDVNDRKLSFTFPVEKNNKRDNFAIVNKQRQEYLSVFEEIIGDIKTGENLSFATENGLEIGKPQVIILSKIDEPNLMPLSVPLLHGLDSNNIKFHYLILYNLSLSNDETLESKIFKNAFFREIETIGGEKPKVWLLDIINDESFNVKEKSNLYKIASHFTDLLSTNEDIIVTANYSNQSNVDGKLCRYSSIGYSVLKYPVEKAKTFMSLVGYTQEYKNLNEKFDLKFEAIMLKDELNKFLTKNGFYKSQERISKKDNNEEIFKPLSVSLNALETEKEIVLSRNLSPIENPFSLSKEVTSDLFRKIDEAEKLYIDDELIEYSGYINSARDRELKTYLKYIEEAQAKFIDDPHKGVNYAILFGAILGDCKPIVEKMLVGRFSEDILTLNSIEDKYREKFIGDEISKIRKEKEREELNSSNKNKLIDEYSYKLEGDRDRLETIRSTDPDNPKISDLLASIAKYDKEVKILAAEIKEHGKNITRLSSRASDIKIEFDRDATKEIYRKERNQNLHEAIEQIRDTQIPAIDKKLSEKYVEKNEIIRVRKKQIFYNLTAIPLVLLLLSFLTQIILFNLISSYTVTDLKNGASITALVIVIYYSISLFRFYKLSQKFKYSLGEISDIFHNKENLFHKFLSQKNKIYRNDFDFEVDLISLLMVGKLKDGASKLQKNIEDFKNRLITDFEKYSKEINTFNFVDNNFELGVLEKSDLNKIYEANTGKALFYHTSEDRLSSHLSHFIGTNDLSSIEKLIDTKVSYICSQKIENENLKTILFNESQDFGEINTAAKIKILLKSSRPLLQTTESHYPTLEKDIPFTENIIIGNFDQKLQTYLDDSQLKFNKNIDESNDNILGILSIKSNFPSFLINDVKENEDTIRKEVNLEDKGRYFIYDSAFQHQLIPAKNHNKKETEELFGDDLITALTNGIIFYDNKNKNFFNEIIGDLGYNFIELIKYWNSPVCNELNKKAKELNAEIWKYEPDELDDYLYHFQNIWIQFEAIVPRNFENLLSEYFFQRSGKEEHWNEIKAAIKENRKNLIKKANPI